MRDTLNTPKYPINMASNAACDLARTEQSQLAVHLDLQIQSPAFDRRLSPCCEKDCGYTKCMYGTQIHLCKTLTKKHVGDMIAQHALMVPIPSTKTQPCVDGSAKAIGNATHTPAYPHAPLHAHADGETPCNND